MSYELVNNPNELKISYLAGPMTYVGPPTWNYPEFEYWAKRLRGAGWKVISPHELHEANEGIPHDWYMRRDIAELIKCGRIVMLDDWEKSKGAKMELDLAVGLGMEIWFTRELEGLSTYELEGLA